MMRRGGEVSGHVIDVDDLDDAPHDDVHDLPPAPPLAAGSELRGRITLATHQPVPSELDVALMAYLLDLEPPAAPAAPAAIDDGVVVELIEFGDVPTPRYRR